MDTVSLSALQTAGLSLRQAQVYLALLQLGSASVSDIATCTGLKRPSIYLLLDELSAQAFVNRHAEHKVLRFSATDPAILSHSLLRSAQEFKEMLPYLQTQRRRNGSPRVTYFQGWEGVQKAYNSIRRPLTPSYLTSIQQAQKSIPEEVDRWRTLYTQHKASQNGRHLFLDTPEDRTFGQEIAQCGQYVRYLPSRLEQMDMDLALFEDKVVLTSYDNEVQMTILESPALFRSFLAIYNILWEQANP